MKKRAHFLISGRVQGVCYRMAAERKAARHGLTGWVANLPNGDVEIVAEGEKEQLTTFLDWCWFGPRLASVTQIETRYFDATGEFGEFTIRYSGMN